ncbi:hypothetical protein L3Q82_024744, partial [Scortum barcoo]
SDILTMQSKQQNVVKSDISPVLFLTVDGEPMSFFLRPGHVKRKLQPLITAGGGLLCNVQQPGAILLIDPEEKGSIPATTAHWYVSTQYIHDCIEKDEQLNLEDYRLNPEVVPRHSARLNNNREISLGLLGGRIAYSPEDDAAILSYVSKHKTETGGNRLWQEMEKQRVTCHSWQSMKYRYRVRLAKKQSEVVEAATTEEDENAAEGESQEEGNQETDAEKPSSAGNAASPQTHSAESDLTQIVSLPAESAAEITETLASPQREVQHMDPQMDKIPAENTQVETVEGETSNSPQPEGPYLDPQSDAQPIPAESIQPETGDPQTVISLQTDSVPEDSPSAQLECPPITSSHKKSKEKQKASPKSEQTPRRSTRRQLQLDELLSPEHYGKKLRSSSSSAEQPLSSPRPSKKTKSAVKTALNKDTTVEQPPAKRARGKTTAAEAESPQEESGQATISETVQADTESNLRPQNGEKKKEKRKLGILELATKEFEDESESGEDEAQDLQSPLEGATVQPASTEPPLPSSDTAADAASTQSSPEQGLQVDTQETQASGSNCLLQTGQIEPAATEPATNQPVAAKLAAAKLAANKAVEETSKAHLFIFDSESQEDDSQSLVGNYTAAPANPQPTVIKDGAFSLTQDQLEEDKQRIRELMNKTKQDLVSVTKALLKTSGDFSVALELLLNPSCVSGPFWDSSDDSLLLSPDPVVRQQLQDKYGEEGVAKRILFLEAEA